MAHIPRLSPADRADLSRRHKLVTDRVMAAEEIGRTILREPIEQATQQLIVRLASESTDPRAIKRTLYRSVNAISNSLAHSAAEAVARSRQHARDLANDQASSDLAGFVQQARAASFDATAPTTSRITSTTSELDAAIANQAGLSIAHKWSSQVLGTYVSWKRSGGGVDLLARGISAAAGTAALESGTGVGSLVETQAITQAVDAYADQHAQTWRDLALLIPGTLYETGGGEDSAGFPVQTVGWGGGLFDVWSAILDRNTCSRCAELDGESVPVGQDWGADGRPPRHLRCRCISVPVWVESAAQLPANDVDFSELQGDFRDHMRSALVDVDQEQAAGHVRRALSGFGALF